MEQGKTIEVWKDIVDYEGYYKISNHGRVISCERTVVRGVSRSNLKEKVLINKFNGSYYFVKLSREGIRKNKTIHRLVAIHFITNDRGASDVNHKDGNKKNNYFENLEWCSQQENMIHATVNALYKGQTPNEVYEKAVALRTTGLSCRKIGLELGINQHTVHAMLNRSKKSKNDNYNRFKRA